MEISSSTWKRASKKWWDEAEHRWNLWEAERSVHIRTQALADKRLVLLRRYDEGLQREPDCFSCGIMAFNEDTEMWEHDPDCELAEAIDV